MSKRVQKKVVQEPIAVVTETPLPEAKVTKKSSKKVTPEVVTEQVNEVPEVTEEGTEEVNEVVSMTFNDIIKSALDEIVSLKTQIRSLEGTIRNVKVLYKEEMKANKSSKKRRRRENGEKQVVNHGFVKPCPISDALASFLGLPSGTELARPEVTKLIANYVRENELWGTKVNKEGIDVLNKTIIKPDAKLNKIFGELNILYSQKKPELGKGLSFFNLHSYLKKNSHFLPQVKTA